MSYREDNDDDDGDNDADDNAMTQEFEKMIKIYYYFTTSLLFL